VWVRMCCLDGGEGKFSSRGTMRLLVPFWRRDSGVDLELDGGESPIDAHKIECGGCNWGQGLWRACMHAVAHVLTRWASRANTRRKGLF
jgi:hypothetical protein